MLSCILVALTVFKSGLLHFSLLSTHLTVEVFVLITHYSSFFHYLQHSVTYVFNCGGGRWLDSGKEDGAIVREFVPTTGSRQETVNTKTATLNLEELDIETLLLDNS